jgi:hypothetical protein
MKNHLELSDQEFQQRFEEGTLDPALFTHEAHIRMAWIYITTYGLEQAIDTICTQLTLFVTRLGAADKFNKTLTIAATKAVYHFILRSKSDNFPSFIAEFPRLNTHFRELMASHYSGDIYGSETARKTFLEPDLLPFD